MEEKGVWIPGMIRKTEDQATNLGMVGPEMLGYSVARARRAMWAIRRRGMEPRIGL